MLSKHGVGTYQGNELTRNSSGNTQPQLSQLAEPLWTDPGLNSGIGVCQLITTSHTQTHTNTHTHTQVQAGTQWLNLPPKKSTWK